MENILLLGNPNTGKTTLFNQLTKSHEKVGNWNGVTNNYIIKKMKYNDKELNVVDLPGSYSLTPLTYEEKVAVDFLYKDNYKSLTLCVCEIDGLSKNLFLALQLLEYGQNLMIVINNKNKQKYHQVDVSKLSSILGVSVFLVDFENNNQIDNLKKEIFEYKKEVSHFNFVYLNAYLKNFSNLKIHIDNFNQDYALTKLLEQDEFFLKETKSKVPDKIEEISYLRHNFIKSLDCIKQKEKKIGWKKIDNVILNKYLAIPIFLLIMLAIFYLTFFSFGVFLSDLLENLVLNVVRKSFISVLTKLTNEQLIISFFEQGIFSAFAIIVKFLPQVLLLFFFLNLIEQSGYLSRVAFIFEDYLAIFGLSGKSVYTVLMGFGCTVPAIMTSRTVANKKTQIRTAILTPYMSCSAKIPIYAVLGGAFFGANNVFVILFLYLFGLGVGFLVSYLLEKTILKSQRDNFVLEFTPLQIIKFKKLLQDIYLSTKEFFKRVFVLIICSNIIIWAMSSFSFNLSYVGSLAGQGRIFFQKSILQVISELIMPIFKPLGFTSWAHVSALITGLIAKEIVVSTLALFGSYGSVNGLANQFKDVTSLVYFSPAGAFSFLMFVLIYPPCFASIGMLKKEIGKQWTATAVCLQIVLAYVLSLIAYHAYSFFQIAPFEFFALIFIVLVFALSLKFIFFKKKCVNCLKNCKKCK